MSVMAHTKHPLYIAIALGLVLIFAVDSMWLMLFRNTYMATLVYIRDVGPQHLPGSDDPIRGKYVGLPLLDYWLAAMVTILANITDGRAPALSVYAFHFSGQLASVVTVLMIEGMRSGNSKTMLASFLPWGLSMTAFGYASVMPLYGIVHVLSSRTVVAASDTTDLRREIEITDYTQLWTLPSSIVLGYWLPVLLMSLPTFASDTHQLFVAAWHFFPLWVTASQILLNCVYSYALTIMQLGLDKVAASGELTLVHIHRLARNRCLRRAYDFAFNVSAFTHIATMVMIGLSKLLYTLTSKTNSITFSGVFLPPYWRSTEPMEIFSQGSLNLLQYDQYAGSLAVIVWAMGLCGVCAVPKLNDYQWFGLVLDVISTSIMFGPGAAVAKLMRQREQSISRLTAVENAYDNGWRTYRLGTLIDFGTKSTLHALYNLEDTSFGVSKKYKDVLD